LCSFAFNALSCGSFHPAMTWSAVSMCSPHQAHSASSGEQFPLLNFSLKTAVLRKAAPIAGYDPPAARTPAA
jgi:hypothetical protein